VKLSDKALLSDEEIEPAMELPEDEAMGGDDAFVEALDLYAKGDKQGAAAALRSAVELCMADYDKD
jgi:hypothetical protein